MKLKLIMTFLKTSYRHECNQQFSRNILCFISDPLLSPFKKRAVLDTPMCSEGWSWTIFQGTEWKQRAWNASFVFSHIVIKAFKSQEERNAVKVSGIKTFIWISYQAVSSSKKYLKTVNPYLDHDGLISFSCGHCKQLWCIQAIEKLESWKGYVCSWRPIRKKN